MATRSATTATTAGQTETPQWTAGEGREGTHIHPATVHEHDHYHVSHHHKDGLMSDWEHRTYWHSHEHNHAELKHSHDYDLEAEVTNHAQEAHIHDHVEPAHSHA
jgi:hypothetical protein